MQGLSLISMKTKDDLNIGNMNMKSFNKNKLDFKTTRKHLNTQKKISQA